MSTIETTNPAWRVEVAAFMRSLFYTPSAIATALEDLRRLGWAYGSESVEPEDQVAVTALYRKHHPPYMGEPAGPASQPFEPSEADRAWWAMQSH